MEDWKITAKARKRTTGIGSLPYTDIAQALAQSFQCGIPFFPELPQHPSYQSMLHQALLSPRELFGFHPFLERLNQESTTRAKIQILGPFTAAQLAPAENSSGILPRILKSALERVTWLRKRNVEVIVFLDEPGLSTSLIHASQTVGQMRNPAQKFSTYGDWITALKQSGAEVGLHCCGETQWADWLKLDWDYVSFDFHLSSSALLQNDSTENCRELKSFLGRGGKLSFGMIPTDAASQNTAAADPKALVLGLTHTLKNSFDQKVAQNILDQALFTPACGTGLLTPELSQQTFRKLEEAYADLYPS